MALLLLAMRNLVGKGVLTSKRNKALDEEINDRFLTSRWAAKEDKIRLRPVKADRDAFRRLFGDTEDYDPTSNLTHNYQFSATCCCGRRFRWMICSMPSAVCRSSASRWNPATMPS